MSHSEPVSDSLATMLSTCTASRLWVEQDEGPYHRGSQPLRRDIVEDRDGTTLQLGIRLAGDHNTPVQDATVEIFPTGGEPAVLDVTHDDGVSRAAICFVLPITGTAT